jgi:hypothetical protein
MLTTLRLVTKDTELDVLAAKATMMEDTVVDLADKVAQALGVEVFPLNVWRVSFPWQIFQRPFPRIYAPSCTTDPTYRPTPRTWTATILCTQYARDASTRHGTYPLLCAPIAHSSTTVLEHV